MVYFFINIVMYLVMILFLCKFYKYKINIYSFIIIIFNLNSYFFFIYQNINFLYGLVILLVSLIINYLFNYFSKEIDEVLLIKDGNINFHELVKYYSYSRLISYLKIKKVSLDEIKYCILKNNQLIIIKNKIIKNLPISLIVDGNLIEDNLKLIHKNKEWLINKLLNKNLLIKNINYAYYKNKEIYFINN